MSISGPGMDVCARTLGTDRRCCSHAGASTSGRQPFVLRIPNEHRKLSRTRTSRLHPALCVAASSGGGSPPAAPPALITLAEVQEVARSRNLTLTVSTLGPGYRILIRDGAGAPDGAILAATTGFVLPPLGLMHCDTLQVFSRGQGLQQLRRERSLGALIGVATMAFGHACGCTKAEILAINDDDAMHAKLVRYYTWYGFRAVRVVTGGLADVPHMLVWGGVGTRMDADVQQLLQRWSATLRPSATAPAQGQGAAMAVAEPSDALS